MIAPAPIRTSQATPNVLSFHCSPAGMMDIFLPKLFANVATAFAFLKQPHKVGVCFADNIKVEPLGEGNTNLVFGLILIKEVGESEYPSLYFRLKSASSASNEFAYSIAVSSFHR